MTPSWQRFLREPRPQCVFLENGDFGLEISVALCRRPARAYDGTEGHFEADSDDGGFRGGRVERRPLRRVYVDGDSRAEGYRDAPVRAEGPPRGRYADAAVPTDGYRNGPRRTYTRDDVHEDVYRRAPAQVYGGGERGGWD
jgi:hypothetical protein